MLDGISQCMCPPNINLKSSMPDFSLKISKVSPSNFVWNYPYYYQADPNYFDFESGQELLEEKISHRDMTLRVPSLGGDFYSEDYANYDPELLESIGVLKRVRWRRALEAEEDDHQSRPRLELKNLVKTDPQTGEKTLPKGLRTDPKSDLINIQYGPISFKYHTKSDGSGTGDIKIAQVNRDSLYKTHVTKVLILAGLCLILTIVSVTLALLGYLSRLNEKEAKLQKDLEREFRVPKELGAALAEE